MIKTWVYGLLCMEAGICLGLLDLPLWVFIVIGLVAGFLPFFGLEGKDPK